MKHINFHSDPAITKILQIVPLCYPKGGSVKHILEGRFSFLLKKLIILAKIQLPVLLHQPFHVVLQELIYKFKFRFKLNKTLLGRL